ncbi:hypothetical protein SDRG_03115 [Saprolegnia diclina VS20]|uniref:Uncharacterized protein n=1 Tax=Saprolegnia diclina (strain VS20) TaxID=1156394 RepID=T0SA66_SAPDV|nr:hypothetical protein SDRG_03115 [Saprolegnia diclina VS20]EQC39687.1 hypothetical protein SDRG_03115 [Saprolegnia diclina VS20]|eukprot:XP_008606959.1 hypothetical protein SDRG_03115 [Saprolegnia diclina VS20]
MDTVDLAALREQIAASKQPRRNQDEDESNNNNENCNRSHDERRPFSLTSASAPEKASAEPRRRHHGDALPWPEITSDAVATVASTLASMYQSVLESHEEFALYLETEPFDIELPDTLLHSTRAHHEKVREFLQDAVARCRSDFEAQITDVCASLQEAFDTQASHVDREVRHQRDRTTSSLKRSRVAIQKQVDHFTNLEACLRRHEMHQLQALHDEKMARAQADWDEKEKRHRDMLLQQKCAIGGIERTNKMLTTMVDDAHAEVERLKHLMHSLDVRKTTSNVISEVYVNSLRDSARRANEVADALRLDLEKVQRDADAVAATNTHLQSLVADRDTELQKVRALLTESSQEIMTLHNINEVTGDDLREAKVRIQDLCVELDAIKVDLGAQTELVTAGDAYVAQLTTRVAHLIDQMNALLTEHDSARATWATEKDELTQEVASLRAQLAALPGPDPTEKAVQSIYKPASKPLQLTTVAAVSRSVQRLKSPLKKSHQYRGKPEYESVARVLEQEKFDVPPERVERAILLEATLREAITCQLTYEFKRAFSTQLQKRLQLERYILDQKVDVVFNKYLTDERAARKKSGGQLICRKKSKKALVDATVPIRRVRDFISQSYEAMGVAEWNGEDIAQLQDDIKQLQGVIADLQTDATQHLARIQAQQLSLAEADLFQKERDLLIVGLTEKLRVLRAEADALKVQLARFELQPSMPQLFSDAGKKLLDVRGQLPHVDSRPTSSTTPSARPMSAVPTPTKAKMPSGKRRPMTSRSHGVGAPPEHARSVLKRDLLMPRVSSNLTSTPEETPQKAGGTFVASLWVGEAGMQHILDRRRRRKA